MGDRCLVIGASGQLGRALCPVLGSRWEVIEAVHRSPHTGQIHLDLSTPKEAVSVVREVKAQWIVIAGAFCGVDRAETQRDLCVRVNVEGPAAIAEYARDHHAFVVYYSTDHVFDGAQPFYDEFAPAHPLNVYTRSKVTGEASIRERLPQHHLVIRTASLYGPDGQRRNFVLGLVDQLRHGTSVPLPQDQWGSPTYTDDLAQATRWLMERGQTGTFHAVGPESLDRVAFARRICAHFGLDESLVVPTPTEQLGQAAPRPLRVRLRCERLQATGCRSFRGIDEGLGCLQQWDRTLQEATRSFGSYHGLWPWTRSGFRPTGARKGTTGYARGAP